MKKGTLKKLISATMLTALLSTTAVYGVQTSYYYSLSLNPTQTLYSASQTKNTGNNFAIIEQQAKDTIIQYTVVNEGHVAKTEPEKISGVRTWQIPYIYNGVIVGDKLKLKAYNYPADNAGGGRVAYGYWTP